MKKSLMGIVFASVLAITSGMAGVDAKSYDKKVIIEPETCNFRDLEFQVDGFFTGVIAQRSHGQTLNSGVGGGTGLNVFFARYFGLGAEAFWYSNDNAAEHMILGNAYFRYPICSINLAPYVVVGGGAGWDGTTVGYGHVGAGLEWRFHKNIGIFADGRYFYGAPDGIGVLRSGLRFAF